MRFRENAFPRSLFRFFTGLPEVGVLEHVR